MERLNGNRKRTEDTKDVAVLYKPLRIAGHVKWTETNQQLRVPASILKGLKGSHSSFCWAPNKHSIFFVHTSGPPQQPWLLLAHLEKHSLNILPSFTNTNNIQRANIDFLAFLKPWDSIKRTWIRESKEQVTTYPEVVVLVLRWCHTLSDAARTPSQAWNRKSELLSYLGVDTHLIEMCVMFLYPVPSPGTAADRWSKWANVVVPFSFGGVVKVIIRTSLRWITFSHLVIVAFRFFFRPETRTDRVSCLHLDFRNLASALGFSSALLCMTRHK